jgi:hypothetical protein
MGGNSLCLSTVSTRFQAYDNLLSAGYRVGAHPESNQAFRIIASSGQVVGLVCWNAAGLVTYAEIVVGGARGVFTLWPTDGVRTNITKMGRFYRLALSTVRA